MKSSTFFYDPVTISWGKLNYHTKYQVLVKAGADVVKTIPSLIDYQSYNHFTAVNVTHNRKRLCFDCRKNPVHFREYSHPSDNETGEKGKDQTCNFDSNSEDEAGFDNRPHCQYGISCYRKNPQHRKDFKHTRAPGEQIEFSRRW